ncbi:MAG TPA: PQQ-binding-like beta-propeller repeat protein [Vicinamibacteria bacterium]|nr:PQQ-binding-like beta-propeller repeat protein [Vicinamibacteria bacterium]
MTRTAPVLLLLVMPAHGLDWPQWRGPARDGHSTDLAPRASWPPALKPAWKVAVGAGYASPVLVGDRVFVFAREGDEEVVQSLELASGRRVWRAAYPAPYVVNSAAASHGSGPKSTPVVAGGRVFTFGIGGVLSCLDAASGRVIWRKDFGGQSRGAAPLYGVAMSPVVSDGLLVAHVGGEEGGALTAFDAATGAVRWAWKGDGPGYASPVVAEIAGVRQVVTLSESSIVSVSAAKGEQLWKVPFTTAYAQNAVTPVVNGDAVIYSGLDQPVRAVRIVRRGAGLDPQPLWENTEVAAYMSTPVLAAGRLYGLSHRKRGQFFSLDAATGRTVWLSPGRAGENAAIVAGGGMLFLLTTDGELIALSQGAASFAPLARYTVAPSSTWAHPVILDAGVVVKDADSLAFLRF